MELRDLIAGYQSNVKDASHVFFDAAIRALQNAKPHQKPSILIDLSEHLGCHPNDLVFLTEKEVNEDDMALPEYRDVLLAAE